MSNAEDTLRQAVETVREVNCDERGEGWLADSAVDADMILAAVRIERESLQWPDDDSFGLIVARYGRTGPPSSLKLNNAGREISRTLHAGAVFGIGEAVVLTQAEPLRVATALVAIVFASIYALRAPVGYNDACVLDAAWHLAKKRQSRAFTREEILDARHEIVERYDAPKCANIADIDEALRNLAGLKAILQTDRGYILQEKITFFKDGRIMG